MTTPRVLVCCSALLLLLEAGLVAWRADGPPYSPADSMATMQVEAGFRIELVASEPDIQSPVAMDIDEDGRLFVVEMPGYPLDTSADGPRQAARGHGRRRPLRDEPGLRRRPGAADGRDALEEGRAGHGARPTSSTSRTRTATDAPTSGRS